MHHSTKAFFDMFPHDRRNDFYAGYMYLKYINRFASLACKSLNLPYKEIVHEDLPPLEEGVREMIETYLVEIAEAAGGGPSTDIYHAKVVQFLDAVKLVTQKENLSLPLPEKVVPWKIARDVILQNPHSLAVGPCGCRLNSDKPCLPYPMEVCLMVGDPAAQFIADLNPKFRKISQEEAVHLLEESHKRGEVHCAYFKREIGNRFFAICNCCKCCCMGVKMWNFMGGIPMAKALGDLCFLVPSGYVAEITDACAGCGTCVDACNFNAMTFDEKTKRPIIDLAKCMGCGGCEGVCPDGAITLKRDPSKGEPLDLDELRL
ncbi:MAG: 4Fe-4S dicluster domain-containing protein [Chloroflexi bacterium]|nr:4Fe-4S dicluster domain-containing protein [Chloroflexota bacterium]